MDHDELAAYCLAKAGAVRDEPWEGDVVAKVGGKIFAFLGSPHGPGTPVSVTLKATAEDTLAWRQRYPDHIGPAPYLQKTTWNRVRAGDGGGPTDDELRELVDDSYLLVVERLPRRLRPPGVEVRAPVRRRPG